MEHIDYFKLQAKNLLKDYKSRFFDEEQNSYAYNPKYFKIAEIFSDFGLPDEKEDFDFCLMNAQHIIAKLSGFSKWNELKDSDADELRSAHRQFDKSVYKINAEKNYPPLKTCMHLLSLKVFLEFLLAFHLTLLSMQNLI